MLQFLVIFKFSFISYTQIPFFLESKAYLDRKEFFLLIFSFIHPLQELSTQMCARILFIPPTEAICVILGNLTNFSEPHFFPICHLRMKVGPTSCTSCVKSMKTPTEPVHMTLKTQEARSTGPSYSPCSAPS